MRSQQHGLVNLYPVVARMPRKKIEIINTRRRSPPVIVKPRSFNSKVTSAPPHHLGDHVKGMTSAAQAAIERTGALSDDKPARRHVYFPAFRSGSATIKSRKYATRKQNEYIKGGVVA